MDQGFDRFKAKDEDWKHIEMVSEDASNCYAAVIRELRDRISALEAGRQLTKPKPPQGLTPRLLCDEQRLQDIDSAIIRYKKAEKAIPREWLDERRELRSRLGRAIAAKEQGLVESVTTAIADNIVGREHGETIRVAISAVGSWLGRNGNQRAAIQIVDELYKSTANLTNDQASS
jgi:hypothetical protein